MVDQVTKRPISERLVDAAFDLFAERGYEHTTVDDIAERAGVGRTTFFRYYRSKEDVIFPAHDDLIAAVQQRLDTSSESTAIVAVTDAVRLVLLRYLAEDERARLRYSLTSRVATLRDREIASAARYQRLFREFIAQWMGQADDAALRAELMAAAVVAAHNHVLRRWLRRDTDDPIDELESAMSRVVTLFSGSGATDVAESGVSDGTGDAAVIILRSPRSSADLVATVRRALESS
jgi:AcrR family transcriptional regulator